jgi:tetratricopeptide (TPR) repeat protein
LLANLNHPALPRVTDYFSEGDAEFLVMQFIPGHDLADLMTIRERPFSVKQVLSWGESLLDALDELHNRKPPIIHRDIKPANLKLTPTGRIILLDFGLAKGSAGQMSTLKLDQSGYSVHGYTKHYAPLEQIRNAGTDSRSDLYSLGATLWSLLTAKLPPDALLRAAEKAERRQDPLRDAHELNSEVPPEVSSVLRRAMSLNRSHRPQTAAVMKAAIKEAGRSALEKSQYGQANKKRAGDSSSGFEKTTSQRRSGQERKYNNTFAEKQPVGRRRSDVDTIAGRRPAQSEQGLAATQPSVAKQSPPPLSETQPPVVAAASANPLRVHTLPANPNVLYSKDDLPIFNVGPSGPLPPGFAKDDLRKSGDLNGKIDEAITRGNLEQERKNYRKAEEEYRRALMFDPSEARAYYALGNLYFEQGRFPEAIQAYKESVRIKPNDSVARKNLGTAYEAQRKYSEAIEQYQEALKLDPNYAHAYHNLAQVYARERRYAEAAEQFKRAIEIEPNYARAHNGLGNVYYAQKNYQAATDEFRRAIQLDPNYVHAYANLGNTYYAEQRYQEAIETYERTIELNPRDAHAYANLGNVYFTQKRYEDAIRFYSRAMQLDSQKTYQAYLLNNLGRVYYAQQRYSTAIEQFKRAIEMDPQQAGAYYSLGLTYLIIKDKRAAEEQYEKLQALGSSYANKLLRELNKVGGLTSRAH